MLHRYRRLHKAFNGSIEEENTYLPLSCCTLPRKEKIEFYQCIAGIKVPSNYSSNIRSLMSMKDLKLVGLKSHDCHALM